MPHDSRHGCGGSDRSRPDTYRDASHPRRWNPGQHAGEPCRLDSRSAACETRQPDAADAAPGRRPPGTGRVPGHAAMMRRPDPPLDGRLALLEETWADPKGVYGWFTHVDHKSMGRRYLVTAFGFFLIGGLLAALMRL